jgi:hypothetical protein
MMRVTAYKHRTENRYLLVNAGASPPALMRDRYNSVEFNTYDLADPSIPFDAAGAWNAIVADGYFISPGIVACHV